MPKEKNVFVIKYIIRSGLRARTRTNCLRVKRLRASMRITRSGGQLWVLHLQSAAHSATCHCSHLLS